MIEGFIYQVTSIYEYMLSLALGKTQGWAYRAYDSHYHFNILLLIIGMFLKISAAIVLLAPILLVEIGVLFLITYFPKLTSLVPELMGY